MSCDWPSVYNLSVFLCKRNAFVQGGAHTPLNFYMEKNIFYLFIALLSSFQQAFGKSLETDLQSIN